MCVHTSFLTFDVHMALGMPGHKYCVRHLHMFQEILIYIILFLKRVLNIYIKKVVSFFLKFLEVFFSGDFFFSFFFADFHSAWNNEAVSALG